MTTEQKYLLNLFNHFLGYGKLNSNLIYFGIEEHGNDNPNIDVEEERLKDYISKYEKTKDEHKFFTMDNDDFKNFYSKYPKQKEIDESNSKKSILYRFCKIIDNKLKEKNSLICNLYPFWKNSSELQYYDAYTCSKFGVNCFDVWYRNNYKDRKKILFYFLNYLLKKNKPTKIFTFGESRTFIELFNEFFKKNLIDIDNPCIIDSRGRNNNYWHIEYHNLMIFILYHPSHKWINENQIDEILKYYE